jgi:hypothetical protein
MNKCADVEITGDISCGVCVPCKVDSDCAPIAIDPVIQSMFAGEPLAQIAGAFLINLLFGNNTDHNLNFYCQPVAAGYGVCAPCSNPLQACGQNQGGGNNPASSCDHGTDVVGGPLSSGCSTCAATVCQADPYCCNTSWDSVCVNEAAQMCGQSQGGNQGGGSCVHSECVTGSKLTTGCSSCAASVCAADSFCCNNSWDGLCVQKAEQLCGATCGGGNNNPPPPSNTCAHGECAVGDKLDASCSTCAATVCGLDSYCCSVSWDSVCVDAASTHCGGCF